MLGCVIEFRCPRELLSLVASCCCASFLCCFSEQATPLCTVITSVFVNSSSKQPCITNLEHRTWASREARDPSLLVSVACNALLIYRQCLLVSMACYALLLYRQCLLVSVACNALLLYRKCLIVSTACIVFCTIVSFCLAAWLAMSCCSTGSVCLSVWLAMLNRQCLPISMAYNAALLVSVCQHGLQCCTGVPACQHGLQCFSDLQKVSPRQCGLQWSAV